MKLEIPGLWQYTYLFKPFPTITMLFTTVKNVKWVSRWLTINVKLCLYNVKLEIQSF